MYLRNLPSGFAQPGIRHKVSASLHGIAVVAAALALSACTVSNTIGTAQVDTQTVAGSITNNPDVTTDGVDKSDTVVIGNAIAAIDGDPSPTDVMSWQNPDNGHRGQISALENVVNDTGKRCKKFQTTVDSFMGISLYDGETCELRRGMWVLKKLVRVTS